MHTLDILVQHYFSTNRTESLTQFFYLLTILFDLTVSFILICLCVAVLIYLVRNLRYAIFFLATLFSGAVAVYLLKMLFNVSRPADAVFTTFGQSFPSYHASLSAIFFILLMYIFDDYWSGISKKVFNFLCILSIFTIAFSRIYLGVHWFSDVFFGVMIGCLISYIAILVFKNVRMA